MVMIKYVCTALVVFCSLLTWHCAGTQTAKALSSGTKAEITVSVSKSSFNPSLGKSVEVKVTAPAGFNALVTMNDAHGLAIRTLHNAIVKDGKPVALQWDGKDDSGTVVPDEAYYVKVLAVKGVDTVAYNPPLFSGGETFTVTDPEVDLKKGTITYSLKQDSRIMIRAGQVKGVMLKSIVHCAPRLKGTVTDYWNGNDPDNLLSVDDLEKWALMIAGYTLPDNSIITYGNKNLDLADYFAKRFPRYQSTLDFPNTSRAFRDRLAARGRRKVNLHFAYPLSKDHAPDLVMEFPNAKDTAEGGLPLLRGLQRVYIDVNPEDKLFHRDQQFELCFFLDGEFISEDEIGYIPYNWIWNTADVAEGEHIVTINISSFKDQIGTKSVKVVIRRN